MAVTADDIRLRVLFDTDLDDGGVKRLRRDLKDVNKDAGALAGTLKRVGAFAAAGFAAAGVSRLVGDLVRVSDEYTELNSRIGLVTSSFEEQVAVREELFTVAQKTRSDYAATADLYTRFARSTEELGVTQRELLTVTEAVNKSLVVSGASSAGAEAALVQLGQGLASGALRGEELNSVMEQSPRLARMLADGLGVTIGELRALGAEGELSSERVVDALIAQASAVDDEFGRMTVTVASAMTTLENAYKDVVSGGNEATGATDSLSGAIMSLADTITENKVGIVSSMEAIAESVSWAVDRLAAFGNAYALFGKMRSGEVGFWDWVTADPDDARRLLGVSGSAFDGLKDNLDGSSRSVSGSSSSSSLFGRTPVMTKDKETEEEKIIASIIGRVKDQMLEADLAALLLNDELFATTKRFEDLSVSMQQDVLRALDDLLESTALFGDLPTNKLSVFGQDLVATDAEAAFIDTLVKGTDDQIGALYRVSDTLDAIGYDLKGVGSFAESIEQLTLASRLGDVQGADVTGAYIKGFASLAAGIGANIGGDIGSAISSAASGALAGMELATGLGVATGPVGAAIGGVIGLAGSLFGGGSDYEQERAARDDVRGQVYDQIVSSALSGGSFSAGLLAAGGYNYDDLKNLSDPGYPGIKYDPGVRLFEDRGVDELETLSEFIAAMDEIEMSMDAVVKTSLASSLDQLAIKYEYLATQVDGYTDALDAQMAEMSAVVLGVTADSLSDMFDAVIRTAEDADHAGRMVAEALELQIVESFKQLAISNAINDAVMPMLQPLLSEIVDGALAGTMSSGEMADLVLQAQEVAASVAPAVSALYSAFDDASVINYSYSGTAIEGRATGGPVIAGRTYRVNEDGVEMFTPDRNGYVVPNNRLGQTQPMQITVQVGSEEFESIIDRRADRVFVRAQRRNGVVNARGVII